MSTSAPVVLAIEELRLGLRGDRSASIVRGVDLSVRRGERVGLVGESGSGKTLVSLSIMGLQPKAIEIQQGRITLVGQDLRTLDDDALAAVRGAQVAMIYQNPMSSLNPTRTVGWQIAEAIRTHEVVGKAALHRRVVDLLGEVGVSEPSRRVAAYPHEFSGGMRQRVIIAMAIACSPAILLADEPTTALDVTTQAKILELLDRLVTERGMGVIFVTHDLAVAASFCDRIDVMYAGRIVESGPVDGIFTAPQHPYSEALLDSLCSFDTDPQRPMQAIGGQPPLAGHLPPGCAFHPRCPLADQVCRSEAPVPVAVPGRWRVECHVRAPVELVAPA